MFRMTFLLSVMTLLAPASGSKKAIKQSILGKITNDNFAQIEIDTYMERIHRTELNTIYLFGDHYRIHSVFKAPGDELDTTFVLSHEQLKLIEKLEMDLKNNSLDKNEIIIAGTRSEYILSVADSSLKFTDKHDYSLLKKLIGKQ
jgi:hypothetical protein